METRRKTMKNHQLSKDIKEHQEAIKEHYKKLNDLFSQCICSIMKKDKPDSFLGEYPNWGSATCETCGKRYDWYCPDSPDHTCHYFSFPGYAMINYVKLIDGTHHALPKEHDPNSEQIDQCIFCGEPEERK